MALADILDVEAIANTTFQARDLERVGRLLDMAAGQVLTFIRADEATVSTWPAAEQTAIRAIVAEIANRRIAAPGSPTVASGDFYGSGSGAAPWMTVLLNPADERRLRRIPSIALRLAVSGAGSGVVTRGDSWLSHTGGEFYGHPTADEFFGQR